MNMTVGGNDPRNVGENLKFGDSPLDCYPVQESLQLQMCDNRRVHHHSAEFHQSFKKPRIPESMRSSNSSASWSKPGRPAKDYAQPCLKFRWGRCNYGEMCNYAHDETRDARKSLYPFGGVVADRLCKYFLMGKTCPSGGNCQFAHDAMGGSSTHRDNAAVSVPVVENSNASQMQQTNRFWRTKLCRKWETFGNCPYGLKCQYAHGVSELCQPGSLNQPESEKYSRVENITVDPENAASTEKPMRTSFKQKEKRCLVKLDSIVKINGIYADWIETMPPVHVISGRQ